MKYYIYLVWFIVLTFLYKRVKNVVPYLFKIRHTQKDTGHVHTWSVLEDAHVELGASMNELERFPPFKILTLYLKATFL